MLYEEVFTVQLTSSLFTRANLSAILMRLPDPTKINHLKDPIIAKQISRYFKRSVEEIKTYSKRWSTFQSFKFVNSKLHEIFENTQFTCQYFMLKGLPKDYQYLSNEVKWYGTQRPTFSTRTHLSASLRRLPGPIKIICVKDPFIIIHQ